MGLLFWKNSPGNILNRAERLKRSIRTVDSNKPKEIEGMIKQIEAWKRDATETLEKKLSSDLVRRISDWIRYFNNQIGQLETQKDRSAERLRKAPKQVKERRRVQPQQRAR